MIKGVSDIINTYDHFILDIFGVVHDGIHPFPGTIEALEYLKNSGKQICLLSNSPRRAGGAAQQMKTMGIGRDLYDHIVTSGEATYHALKERPDAFHQNCGHDCWFIGTGLMFEMLDGLDLNILDGPEGASFILNAAPGADDGYEKSLDAPLKAAIKMGLPMICSNPDLVVNIGDTQYLCAGTYAAAYEGKGGKVVYHGKPHAPVYERCHALLGRPEKSKVVAIGDSLHTDIAGANGFGIDSVFNLVGIHWEEVQLDHAPGEADLAKIEAMLEEQHHKPTYTMAGFAI